MSSRNYQNLYQRNGPIISSELQQGLQNLRVAVAGCGSTGGAVIDGMLRLGIENFHLCDNGSYEMSNMNRQMVSLTDIGRNKAAVYAERIKNVNQEAHVKVWTAGLIPENVDIFLNDIDFLFDAVDVTTNQGMKMKLLLHEKAAARGIPTGSALDLGFTQWLQSYNYHLGEAPLLGKLEEARKSKHPLKTLIAGFSALEDLPFEISEEISRLIKAPDQSACQLACACFLLSGLMTPYLLYFLSKKKLPPLLKVDLMSFFENSEEKVVRVRKTLDGQKSLNEILKKIA